MCHIFVVLTYMFYNFVVQAAAVSTASTDESPQTGGFSPERLPASDPAMASLLLLSSVERVHQIAGWRAARAARSVGVCLCFLASANQGAVQEVRGQR